MGNLGKYLSVEHIRCKQEAGTWEEAIRMAAKPLLEDEHIQPSYVERTIEKVKELGPYIVIAKGIALAHARPKEDVIHESMAMVTLKEPVCFGHKTNDPVNVVFFLAASSDNSHIEALMNVAQRLSIEGVQEKIATCDTPQEIYELMVM